MSPRETEARRLLAVWTSCASPGEPMPAPWELMGDTFKARWLALADDSLAQHTDPDAAVIQRAAAEWPPQSRKMLAYLISLGQPGTVLTSARRLTARGLGATSNGLDAMPPTTAAQWVLTGALGLWRDIGVALGIDLLPPPGSVHASVAKLPEDGQ